MNNLITINNDSQTISARELHEKLNIGTKFATWFQRICEYGFIENQDYTTCYPNLGSENHVRYKPSNTLLPHYKYVYPIYYPLKYLFRYCGVYKIYGIDKT